MSSLTLLVGKITLPSTILQFWDLGGQRDIRSIWSKYYDECHAVIYCVDASDSERLEEGWEVFGSFHVMVLRAKSESGIVMEKGTRQGDLEHELIPSSLPPPHPSPHLFTFLLLAHQNPS